MLAIVFSAAAAARMPAFVQTNRTAQVYTGSALRPALGSFRAHYSQPARPACEVLLEVMVCAHFWFRGGVAPGVTVGSHASLV